MKKLFILVFLFLYVSVYAQQQSRFIIGAEHVSSFADFGGPLLHSNSFWDTVKAFGLNYAGLKYFQQYPVSSPTLGTVPLSKIVEDLDKAAARNIDVYLTNGFDRNLAGESYYPKRWLYQVEKVIGNNLNDYLNVPIGQSSYDNNPDPNLQALTHWNLAPPSQGTHNYLHLELGDPYGIVANNLREKNLQPDGLNYYLKVRMRLPDAASYPNINVLTVRVKKAGGSSIEGTIKANEFSSNNWQVIPVRCFYKTENGPIDCIPNVDESTVYNFTDTIGTPQLRNYVTKPNVTFTPYDIEIEWLNTAPYNYQVDLDWVAVDDETANRLYPPKSEFDARIEDFANNYKNEQAVKSYMVL